MNENEIQQTFTIADLRAQLEAERASRQAFVIAYIDLLVERELLKTDNVDLAKRMDALIARTAELADENQLLRDEVPVPFTITEPVQIVGGPHLSAVPDQRAAGSES